MPGQKILQNHNLMSHEIQDVISRRPRWIVRNGNTFFFLVIALLFFLTWFIDYPDTIPANATITATHPAKPINTKTEGRLLKLFIANEQDVNKDQHLAYLENTTDYDEAIRLQKWVTNILTYANNDSFEFLIACPLPSLYNLGELQIKYQEVQRESAEILQTLGKGYYQNKIESVQKDLRIFASIINNAYQQEGLIKMDYQMQKKEFDAYEALEKEKVIAPLELNQYRSKLLSKDEALKQIHTQITQAELEYRNKQKELLDLQKTIQDGRQKFFTALLELKAGLEKWSQQYVVTAPEKGKVYFLNSLQQNDWITQGQSLFYIQPAQGRYYAELVVSQRGLGKIKPGNNALLKVESYPSNEFGHLAGTVSYISNMAFRRDSFLIRVELNNGLQTNHNKTIVFRNNLTARAEIIIDNRKLFQKLAGQLVKIWEK